MTAVLRASTLPPPVSEVPLVMSRSGSAVCASMLLAIFIVVAIPSIAKGRLVVSQGDPLPGTSGTFDFLGSPALHGEVIHLDALGSIPSGAYFPGIYRFQPGQPPLSVVDPLDLLPSGSETFGDVFLPATDGDDVAFSAVTSGNEGVYAIREGQLELIADEETDLPGRAGRPRFPGEELSRVFGSSIDEGTVVFSAEAYVDNFSTDPAIYADAGAGLFVLLDVDTPFPSGSGTFEEVSGPKLDAGDVVFTATSTNGDAGIYRMRSGTLQVIADSSTPIPGGSGTFNRFDEFAVSDGDVAFNGHGPNQSGVYRWRSGSLEVVADLDTPVPGVGGALAFDGFGQMSLDGDRIAFEGFVVNPGQGTISSVAAAIPSTAAAGSTGTLGSMNIFGELGEGLMVLASPCDFGADCISVALSLHSDGLSQGSLALKVDRSLPGGSVSEVHVVPEPRGEVAALMALLALSGLFLLRRIAQASARGGV